MPAPLVLLPQTCHGDINQKHAVGFTIYTNTILLCWMHSHFIHQQPSTGMHPNNRPRICQSCGRDADEMTQPFGTSDDQLLQAANREWNPLPARERSPRLLGSLSHLSALTLQAPHALLLPLGAHCCVLGKEKDIFHGRSVYVYELQRVRVCLLAARECVFSAGFGSQAVGAAPGSRCAATRSIRGKRRSTRGKLLSALDRRSLQPGSAPEYRHHRTATARRPRKPHVHGFCPVGRPNCNVRCEKRSGWAGRRGGSPRTGWAR
jgi:hypothetical protein